MFRDTYTVVVTTVFVASGIFVVFVKVEYEVAVLMLVLTGILRKDEQNGVALASCKTLTTSWTALHSAAGATGIGTGVAMTVAAKDSKKEG